MAFGGGSLPCLGVPGDLLPTDAVPDGHLRHAVHLGLGGAVIAVKNRKIPGYDLKLIFQIAGLQFYPWKIKTTFQ